MTVPVRRSAVLGLVVLAAAALPAAGAPRGASVHLCGDRTLFLVPRETTLWPEPAAGESYRVTVLEVPKDVATMVAEREAGKDPVAEVGSVAGEWTASGTMIRAALPSALRGGRDHRVHLDLVARGGVIRVGAGELSTRARAIAVPSGAGLEASYRFEVYSRTPLADLPDVVELTEVARPAGARPAAGGGHREVPAIVRRHTACRGGAGPDCCPGGAPGVAVAAGAADDACAEPVLTSRSPGGFPASGGALFCLPPGSRLGRGSHELRLGPLRDVFGQEVVATGPLPRPVAPKGKGDARYFVSARFESADEADDALALDLALRPSLRLRGAWLLRPELTVSLARDLPRSSDSVRLASLLARSWLRDEGFLAGHTLSIGPAAEADRDLDRVNALVDLRWEPELRGLYQPREVRRRRLALQPGMEGTTVHLPPWGWGLRGWLGVEAGGSVKEQAVDGGAGREDLEIPSFEILRLRAQVQAFVEYRRLALDVSSGLRYLAAGEPVARRVADGEPIVVELDEGRPYTEVSLSWALDATGNVALAGTYRNGSEPPDYRRVDKLTLGVVAKY